MRTLTPFELSLFLLRFRQLSTAGLTPDQSLAQLAAATADPAMKSMLQQAVVSLQNGAPLCEALCPGTGHPFPPFLHNNLQAVGRSDNSLKQALNRALEYVALSPGIGGQKNHVEKLLLMLAPFTFFLLGSLFIVPVCSSMFADFGGELPWLTTVVIATSEFANRYLIIVLAVVCCGAWYYLKRQRLKIHDQDRAAAFGLMASSVTQGYALQESFELASLAAASRPLQERLDMAAAMFSNGQTLAETLKQSKLISPLAGILLALEDQLQAKTQLSALTEHYQRQARQAAKRAPMFMIVSMIVTAVVLLTMICSMYLPIFKLSGAV